MTERLIPVRRSQARPEVTDEALVSSCAGGDNVALDELFQRHGDRVHRILARLGSVDPRDLEDVVQATFMAVRRAARQFDRRSAVATWIAGIALNVARRHARSESRRRVAMSAVAHARGRLEGPGPDEQAAHRELMARMLAGFAQLPMDLRTAFALCDLEGMRGVDVARALRVPEGTVWRRLHEARVRLRAFMLGGDREGQA
jgi:RNA polymerase sigma-70 factor (ECF subfamily)